MREVRGQAITVLPAAQGIFIQNARSASQAEVTALDIAVDWLASAFRVVCASGLLQSAARRMASNRYLTFQTVLKLSRTANDPWKALQKQFEELLGS